MTSSTLSYILNTHLNVPVNTWVSLYKSVSRMNLLSDAILSVDPRYRLYYFDTNTEMVYVQYLDGFTNDVNTQDSNSYVTQIIDGNTYKANISKNYIVGSVGRYHQAISMSQIVSLSYVDREKEKQLWID